MEQLMDQLLGEPGDQGLGLVRTHLDQAQASATQVTDPELLQLCTMRMAMLLQHPLGDSPQAEGLAGWTTNTTLSATQRACLEFTEQFVIDVASMTDLLAQAVKDQLGEQGVVDFANALLTMEQRLRLELVWKEVL